MRPYLLIALLITTGGCVTPTERAQQMEREVDQMIQIYGPACDRMGYQPKSDGWRSCVLQLNQQDIDRTKGQTSCARYGRFWPCPI